MEWQAYMKLQSCLFVLYTRKCTTTSNYKLIIQHPLHNYLSTNMFVYATTKKLLAKLEQIICQLLTVGPRLAITLLALY